MHAPAGLSAAVSCRVLPMPRVTVPVWFRLTLFASTGAGVGSGVTTGVGVAEALLYSPAPGHLMYLIILYLAQWLANLSQV